MASAAANGAPVASAAADEVPAASAPVPAAAPASAPVDPDWPREIQRLQSQELGLAQIPVATDYLNQLLARIQAAGPQPPRPARVLIWPRLSYNATTRPSGLIVIDLGWLETIDSEAELTGLLSHEYGHLALNHLGTKNQVGMATQAALVGLALVSARAGGAPLTRGILGGSWSELLMPKWSREQEFEADRFAFDTTQALGLPFVTSVRAFLERIRSVEATRTSTAGDGSLEDSHPDTDERIARLQALMQGRPRVRPVAHGPDGWRAVRDSAAFKAAAAEYAVTAGLGEAFRTGNQALINQIAQKVARGPQPPRTSAGLLALAVGQSTLDANTRFALLKAAAEAPDASMLPYGVLAQVERDDLKQYPAAYQTLDAGMTRFDQPPPQYPNAVRFLRLLLTQVDAIPSNQRGLGLDLFSLRVQMALIGLKARCMTEPSYSDACSWADLTDAQRAQRSQQQRDLQNRMEQKMDAKIQKLLH